jgi:hypothetical protein
VNDGNQPQYRRKHMAAETSYPRLGRVNTPYTAQYPDPITLRAGEHVMLDGRADPWDGNPEWIWLWGTDPRGKSGWVPHGYVESLGEHRGRALRDYAATELTAEAGERVTIELSESGWLWCVTSAGRAGWLPAANVTDEATEHTAARD